MSNNLIDAIYIFDHTNQPILEHVYRGRPPSPKTILPIYLSHPAPRSPLIYSHETSPPTLIFSVIHASLLFLVPSSTEVEPLFVLEFLHRLCDVLEEFLGSPLLASKIESSYDVVAQLLGEMCDAGNVCNTEPNALRDVVGMPGWMDKLLSGVGLQGSSPSLQSQSAFRAQLALNNPQSGPAIPWRRANVKHTSNELYVDIVETVSVILAPSGRPLSAFSHGSILFTAKISGVPDLLLTLSVPGGKHTIPHVLELPTFHPCVRLARWKEHPGELSFVPPDGKFLLAGYEVNLLPSENWTTRGSAQRNLQLPATIEMSTSLGPAGLDFEVRLAILTPNSSSSTTNSTGQHSSRSTTHASGSRFNASRNNSSGGGFFASGNSSSTAAPTLQDVVVTIPIPHTVRNILDLKASRGEANFSTTDHEVEWRLNSREASAAGTATLRCTVVGPLSEDTDLDAAAGVLDGVNGLYIADEEELGLNSSSSNGGYQNSSTTNSVNSRNDNSSSSATTTSKLNSVTKSESNRHLMPHSGAVSFSVKGWLPSGVRVDSLVVDVKRSRGLGEGVKPVKGAKYLTISRKGVETRC